MKFQKWKKVVGKKYSSAKIFVGKKYSSAKKFITWRKFCHFLPTNIFCRPIFFLFKIFTTPLNSCFLVVVFYACICCARDCVCLCVWGVMGSYIKTGIGRDNEISKMEKISRQKIFVGKKFRHFVKISSLFADEYFCRLFFSLLKFPLLLAIPVFP